MPDLADKRRAALDELTREEIRKAANRVIAEHGMAGMTMSMVAEAAGLAKGTLYNYFQDKNDLIFYVMLKAFEPLTDQMEEVADADVPPVEQIARAAQTILGGFAGHQQMVTMAVESRTMVDPAKAVPEIERMRVRIDRSLTRIFKRGMDQGAFIESDPANMARLFFAFLMGLIHPRIFLKAEHAIEDDVKAMVDIFLHGIAPQT